MLRFAIVFSVVFLTGCAGPASQDNLRDRYAFNLKSVENSNVFLSQPLMQYSEHGEDSVLRAFTTDVAEIDNPRSFVLLKVKPDYADDSMDLTLTFDYCDGVVIKNDTTYCDNVIGTYQERLNYRYDTLPEETILDNGLQFEVSVFEM
ncbi:hypothetical protein [Vreelandella neptunia]|uniref:Lipoprotein n=1 Tax=Vreelandella neptunia TaxID=115551 RepID=A0ABZ0YRN0_9GAMM|nr:hypothetical protein [Halomonas neptunia]MDN3561732.1 hypothetical protein [Halomonas neptunia]WQH14633.1 hypothetical protein SR894_08860 [Halomonas neptunia]